MEYGWNGKFFCLTSVGHLPVGAFGVKSKSQYNYGMDLQSDIHSFVEENFLILIYINSFFCLYCIPRNRFVHNLFDSLQDFLLSIIKEAFKIIDSYGLIKVFY